MNKRYLIVIAMIAIAATAFAQQTRGAWNDVRPYTGTPGDTATVLADIPAGDLDTVELEGLLLMREEEKLARDVYLTLADQWGIRVFDNIARSEETHMSAVADLLERYDIEDPVTSNEVGAFTSSSMQKLYDDLVASGSKSYSDALAIGAKIEELDIADLQRLIEATDNEDIRLVYENLLNGSKNHLRAFDMQLQTAGITYYPEHLSAAEYEDIIMQQSRVGGPAWSRN